MVTAACTMSTIYRNHGYEIFLNSNHDMIRLRHPVRAFFLIQMRPPARESLYFKASEPLQNSLHRILSLVSGLPRPVNPIHRKRKVASPRKPRNTRFLNTQNNVHCVKSIVLSQPRFQKKIHPNYIQPLPIIFFWHE